MNSNQPTILTVFGATGDLMDKKIIPAIYTLFEDGRLPEKFKVIGFARRDFTGDKFCKEIVRPSIEKRLSNSHPSDTYLDLFEYVQGSFDGDIGYNTLEKRFGEIDEQFGETSKKLFFYSIQPSFYEEVTSRIADIVEDKSTVRLLVEKPYGRDVKSALLLDQKIKHYFGEEQIFRIDHYLEKDAVKQILSFRSNHPEYLQKWNGSRIKKIEVVTHEDYGVEDRGAFYESVGAFIDVGQNHLLSMVALVAMQIPRENEDYSSLRAEILEAIQLPSDEYVSQNSYRAQYEGYTEIKDVDENSTIETFFKLRLALELDGWEHTQITIQAGKSLARHEKFVRIYFDDEVLTFELHPTGCVYSNKLHNDPHKEIKLQCVTSIHQYVAEYAQVIVDSIQDDRSSFLSIEEVLAQWKFADPIRDAWDRDVVPLHTYQKGETPKFDL